MQKNLEKVICIFGASGFIGRHLIRRLTKKTIESLLPRDRLICMGI